MIGTFRSAWIKLRRPALLWGTYGAVALVMILITSVTFLTAGATATTTTAGPGGPGGPGGDTTLAQLGRAGGLLTGLTGGISLLGVIALCVAVAALAGEFTTGTLRNLLLRQPNRAGVFAGSWAAVISFTIGAIALGAAVAAVTAIVLAHARGIDTSAWFTSSGWTTSARSLADVAVAGAGYATLGVALGTLLRSSVPAIAAGIAWLLPIELVLANTVSGSARWLPGQLLTAIASDGTAQVAFGTALVTAGLYLVAAMAIAGTAMVRRDVTA